MSQSIANGQKVIEVIAGDGTIWSIDGQLVTVDQKRQIPEAVLSAVFTRVEGEGPWRVDVSLTGGVVHKLILRTDGSTAHPGELVRVEVKVSRIARILGRFTRKRTLIGVASLVAIGAVAGTTSNLLGTGSDAKTSATSATGHVLWEGPSGVVPVGAAGSLVAAVKGSQLVLADALTGSKVAGFKGAPVADTARVTIATGGNLTVVDTGADNGVLIVDGKASTYTGKGTLLGRGPVPVIVGGTPGDRKNFVVKDGALVEVQAPEQGNSLFGGLSGGGSVWAVSGGKVTYVPATEAQRTISLVPPNDGATVSSWVAVTNTRTAVIWKTGKTSVLAVHSTGAGSTGAVEYQLALKDGETALARGGRVFVGSGPISTISPSAIRTAVSLEGDKVNAAAPSCPMPLITSEQLWCAGDKGQWMAGNFSVPSEPLAAGKGFVLLAEGERFVVVSGPDATTTK